MKGFEAAVAAGAKEVAVFAAASEQFSTSISVTLKRSSMFRLSVRKRVVDLLPPRQLEAHAAVACCLANEFEASTVDAWFVGDVVERARVLDGASLRLRLADGL